MCVREGFVKKLAAVDQIGQCAVTVIPHLGYGMLQEAQIDTGTLLLNQCLV